jgi:hypothetical protein
VASKEVALFLVLVALGWGEGQKPSRVRDHTRLSQSSLSSTLWGLSKIIRDKGWIMQNTQGPVRFTAYSDYL